MKYLRIALALLALAAMTLLFTVPSAAVCRYLGWLPRAQLVPAILAGEVVSLAVLAVLTVLFGRVYCAVVCPLGTAQDLVGPVFRFCRKRSAEGVVPGSGKAAEAVRYSVLALFVIALICGFTALIEPYGIFGRFLAVGVMRSGEPPALLVVWAVALFVFILAMTVFRARWWCNTVCPVGTFLGLFSRFALFRVRIDREKCVGCGSCVAACDKGAIAVDGKTVRVAPSKCVMCMDCFGSCGKGGLRWR